MAFDFRRPLSRGYGGNPGSPSLGYRLSSDRQPGIEQANNMRRNPTGRSLRDIFKDQGKRREQGRKIPGASNPDRDKFQDYLNRGLAGGHQGIGSLTPSNIGVDRHPTTMDPITTMLYNPQVMRDWQDKRKLEEQMDPDNFFGNRLDVSRQFGVGPFDDIFHSEPTGRTLFGDEQSAVDPSDWRTLEAIMGAGGNPDDYVQMAAGSDLDPWDLEKLENYWGMPPDWDYDPEDLVIDPFDENQLFGHTSKVAALKPDNTNINDIISGGPFYPENEGIMQMAELGLPKPMDWQNERLSLDQLINLGASQDQIAQYLGVA